MYKKLIGVVLLTSMLAGCASVPMESAESQSSVEKFNPPSEGSAGLYIYRSGSFGGALKKDVWVDGECVGETAPNVFFYHEVPGDKEHKISTESEFSPNDLIVKTENGKNYFIQQYIKMGVLVGGAGLKEVEEEEGKKAISKLKMAIKGTCNK